MMRRLKKLRTLAHQESWPQWPPLLLVSAELVETLPPADFLLLGWASFPHSKWGLLAKDAPARPWHRPWHRSLLYWEIESSPWSGLGTPLRRKRLRQTQRKLMVSLCQRSTNMAIQASLIRRNHIHETVKKRELCSVFIKDFGTPVTWAGGVEFLPAHIQSHLPTNETAKPTNASRIDLAAFRCNLLLFRAPVTSFLDTHLEKTIHFW